MKGHFQGVEKGSQYSIVISRTGEEMSKNE